MGEITTVGLDLAKRVAASHAEDCEQSELRRRPTDAARTWLTVAASRAPLNE